jgi:DNA polymerase
MIRLEMAKYPVILTVHDEIICETDPDFGSEQEFNDLMCVVPDWVSGCPISVACWREIRYRK